MRGTDLALIEFLEDDAGELFAEFHAPLIE
jgi:hypothetical protein